MIVPKAIYFDTNALIAAPDTLVTQPLAEILEIANQLHAGMFIPELAAKEWLARCCSDAIRYMSQVRTLGRKLGTFLGDGIVSIADASDSELAGRVRAVQAMRLIEAGLGMIKTPPIELEELINRFLIKAPPFNEGDRGFKDAVILETIFQHACRDQRLDHIVIVSGDKLFGHDMVVSRFAEAGTSVHIVNGSPQELLTKTVSKLKTMVSQAIESLMAAKCDKATAFAKRYESDILRFVEKTPIVTFSLLMGYGRSQAAREKDENDRKLEYARILSVDRVKPLSIVSAFPSPVPPNGDTTRKKLIITIRLEISLTIAWRNCFAEPRVSIEDAPALLEKQAKWRYPEIEESVTVNRDLYVSASVSAEGFDDDNFQDLRLESAG